MGPSEIHRISFDFAGEEDSSCLLASLDGSVTPHRTVPLKEPSGAGVKVHHQPVTRSRRTGSVGVKALIAERV